MGKFGSQPILDAEAQVLLGDSELTLGVMREPEEILCVVGGEVAAGSVANDRSRLIQPPL